MKTLNVPDMHCEMCVKRISTAFGKENIPFEISLESKTVSVNEGDIPDAKDILDDLGFSVKE